MSYVFDVGNQTVWSPALQVGDLYLQIAKTLAEWAGSDTGLLAKSEDWYEIDVDRFSQFLRTLLTGPAAHHTLFREMTEGFLAISLAMLTRAGRPLSDPEAQDLAGRAATAARSMPEL
jgi:hypothetical protein